jgi:threonine dehydrogenase-like Zn-dependent dehydrogenase
MTNKEAIMGEPYTYHRTCDICESDHGEHAEFVTSVGNFCDGCFREYLIDEYLRGELDPEGVDVDGEPMSDWLARNGYAAKLLPVVVATIRPRRQTPAAQEPTSGN